MRMRIGSIAPPVSSSWRVASSFGYVRTCASFSCRTDFSLSYHKGTSLCHEAVSRFCPDVCPVYLFCPTGQICLNVQTLHLAAFCLVSGGGCCSLHWDISLSRRMTFLRRAGVYSTGNSVLA